jgi:hypothetical protein
MLGGQSLGLASEALENLCQRGWSSPKSDLLARPRPRTLSIAPFNERRRIHSETGHLHCNKQVRNMQISRA